MVQSTGRVEQGAATGASPIVPGEVSIVDVLSLGVAVAAAYYARSQKKIASKALKEANAANSLAETANEIAKEAQSSALEIARRSAGHADAIARYNADCVDLVRPALAALLEFPRTARAAVEHQRYSTDQYDTDWDDVRKLIEQAKNAIRLQMQDGLIPPADYDSCFTGAAYDDVADAARAVSSNPSDGIFDRIERLREAAEQFSGIVRAMLDTGRDAISDKHFLTKKG